MWTDDLDVVESCDFYRSLLNFDSIDSIGALAATNTFVYMKAPTRTAMNRDASTGPVARPFADLLTPLTHSLAPLAHSWAHRKVND